MYVEARSLQISRRAAGSAGMPVSEFDTICVLALRNHYTSCPETLMHASGVEERSKEHGISVLKGRTPARSTKISEVETSRFPFAVSDSAVNSSSDCLCFDEREHSNVSKTIFSIKLREGIAHVFFLFSS